MSGHSKWHNIQVRKGKQDKARANVFTKMARLITIAARAGGGDPEANFALRLAMEKARAANMPKDNIERAIKRGTGELADSAALEEILYEGFAPGGAAVLVEAVTDNKTRTVSDIKHIFTAHGGTLAGPGSVQWQFERFGVVRINKSQMSNVKGQVSDFELRLIEAGADDLVESEHGLEIFSPVDKLQSILGVVKSLQLELDDSGLEWVAKEAIKVEPAPALQVEKLIEALDNNDDVKAVYANANF